MTYRGSLPPGQAFPGHPATPQAPYPSYMNGNTPYQNAGSLPPTYQPQPVQYYANNVPPFPSYDGGFDPPAPIPPMQFAQPMQAQQMAPPVHSYPALSSSQHVVRAAQSPPLVAPTGGSPRMVENRQPAQGGRPKAVKEARRPSSGAVSKSPVTSHSPGHHIDTLSLLVYVAEDCFARASDAAKDVARSLNGNGIHEYHKLIATGLGCLEAALQSSKPAPRAEARIRLRYAGVLVDETENLMEAETALTKGIATCEKHRFIDLKYCMQFLLVKVLFRRNRKAALIAIDAHISDCTTYKQIHWAYAFRFLKASFYLQSGNPADTHAMENLRSMVDLASRRGDNAICVMSSLLEGLTHLLTMKDDAIVRVQTCIAQVSKYQLDASVHLPQIDVLVLLLDLACSLHQKVPATISQKMTALQAKMEALRSEEWETLSTELLLPVKKQNASSQVLSADTSAILRPGSETSDYLVLSILSKSQGFALGYTFCGLAALYKSSTLGRSSMYWREALVILEQGKQARKRSAASLGQALDQEQWESDFRSYIYVLLGLQAATLSDWRVVKECMLNTAGPKEQSSQGMLNILALYLSGVYYQGTGELDAALRIFEDRRFNLASNGTTPSRTEQVHSMVSILAALNRLWIMQLPARAEEAKTAELLEQLRPLCENNSDPEIKTAYNLVMASIQMGKPLGINQVKRHIQQSLSGAQATSNTHCLSIALNIMRCRLFENVVGEQALKSAKAGSAQAKKSGNLLWMSVADGMLAKSYEMQGSAAEALMARESGTNFANEAFAKTQS